MNTPTLLLAALAIPLAACTLPVGLGDAASSSSASSAGLTTAASVTATTGGGGSTPIGTTTGGGGFAIGTRVMATTTGGGGAALPPPPSCAGSPWSRSFGNDGEYPLAAAVVDADCNVIFAGMALGPVNLGGGVEGGDFLHIVVVKLDAAGHYLWSRQFPTGAFLSSGKGLAVDAQGNVFLGGTLEGTVDLGGDALVYGGNGMADDLFLAKLDRDGNHLWSKGFNGDIDGNGISYFTRDILAIAAAPNGDVLLTGQYTGLIGFGGNGMPDAGYSSRIFLARFDAKGQFISQKSYGGEDSDRGEGLAFRADGSFLLAATCSPGTSLGGAVMLGNSSACLASYDPAGEQVWTRFFSGGEYVQLAGLALEADGGILFGGSSGTPIDFGGGAVGPTNNGFGFVVRLDASGHHAWSLAIGGASVEGIASTPALGAVATGWFYGPTDAAGATLTGTGPDDMNAFFLKLGAEGNYVSSGVFGDGALQRGNAVAVDPMGHVYLAGSFAGSINLGQGLLQAPAADTDSFAARLPE